MAAYRLADRFHIWNVPQWLSEIPWILFLEWLQYYEIEPVWYDEDLRTGQIIAILAEINRDKEKRSEPFVAEDFMPRLRVFREMLEDEGVVEVGRKVSGGRSGKTTRAMGLKEWRASK